jgi:polyisoprenoid-binding protein YceI
MSARSVGYASLNPPYAATTHLDFDMLKNISLVIAALTGLVLIVAATKPDTFSVERSITINAPPATVHPLVDDFRKWSEWSPWEKLDPNMQRTHSGAASGVGAVYAWQGNSDVGEGRMEIVESSPYKVSIKLDFVAPMEASNVTVFELMPQGEATHVRWTMSGESNFVSKLMQVFMSMDSLVGGDFEKGLADMKAAAEKAAEALAPTAFNVPAGDYVLEKYHAQLLFSVDHVGFSNYTGQFKRFDAKLKFDPTNLAASSVTATIDPRSLDLVNPPAGFVDTLLSAAWLDAKQFPQITFASTNVEQTAVNKVRITGDFALHGVTKPVTFDVTFNGGYPGLAQLDPNARIGFSARGVLRRSDFGITYGIPEPGSKMGVSDAVQFMIEAEFTGPPLKDHTD